MPLCLNGIPIDILMAELEKSQKKKEEIEQQLKAIKALFIGEELTYSYAKAFNPVHEQQRLSQFIESDAFKEGLRTLADSHGLYEANDTFPTDKIGYGYRKTADGNPDAIELRYKSVEVSIDLKALEKSCKHIVDEGLTYLDVLPQVDPEFDALAQQLKKANNSESFSLLKVFNQKWKAHNLKSFLEIDCSTDKLSLKLVDEKQRQIYRSKIYRSKRDTTPLPVTNADNTITLINLPTWRTQAANVTHSLARGFFSDSGTYMLGVAMGASLATLYNTKFRQ